jgi:hypothetical protein
MRCLPSSILFSTTSQLWRLPKIEGSNLNYFDPPLWPRYIGERRTTFAKAYGIKVRCYGEHVGEHIGNLMRTHWELKRNIVGTNQDLGENEKILFPHKLKRKKCKAC